MSTIPSTLPTPRVVTTVIDSGPREHAAEALMVIQSMSAHGVYNLDTLAHEIARVHVDPYGAMVKFQEFKSGLLEVVKPHADGPYSIAMLSLDTLFYTRLDRKD